MDELEKQLLSLFDDLFVERTHSTDIDACYNHEKHTAQCYGCRHAKWQNIIQSELKERLKHLKKFDDLLTLISDREKNVDRLEVIDETGRAYVRGSIYGTPVKVELSYQDNNRTLKVFVKALQSKGTNRL